MVMGQTGAVWDLLRDYGIEIRALKRRVEAFSAGDTIRADAISGIIPAANAPVYWWYNGNLLGAGTKADFLEGAGVWISGTFVAGRAYYYIGAYSMGGGASGTVNWYEHNTLIGSALEVDFEPGNCVWISGHMVGGRPTYDIGVYPGCAGGPGGGMSGVDWYRDGAWLGFGAAADLQEESGVWISGTFAAGRAYYGIGTYADPWISGVDWNVNDYMVGWGRSVDFHDGVGVWISGTFVGGEAVITVGAYPTPVPASISGVAFAENGDPLCFGAGLDLQEEWGVWISGSCLGGEATYKIGAYSQGGGGAPHAILDGSTHTDSVAQGVSRGSLIYGNATPKWDELVIGAAYSVLYSNGTDAAWSAAPRLANIADTGGTARVTLATASPHVSLTGDVDISGHLALGNAAAVDASCILYVAETMVPTTMTYSALSIVAHFAPTAADPMFMYGINVELYLEGKTDVLGSAGQGFRFILYHASPKPVMTLVGYYVDLQSSSAATGGWAGAKYAVCFYADGPIWDAASGAPNKVYGLKIEDLTHAQNDAGDYVFGVHISLFDADTDATRWAFFYGDTTVVNVGITAAGQLILAGLYGTSAPALTTNGAIQPAYVSSVNRVYFYTNAGLHYVNATAGIGFPERSCAKCGGEFAVGAVISWVIDEELEPDGVADLEPTFHAVPVHFSCSESEVRLAT